MLKRFKAGFTLVELSISIAFIAILSNTITMLTTNVIATYQRGLTIKQINTTGMNLIKMPVQGAFCTGTYSYLWNSGYYYSGEHGVSLPGLKLIYKDGDGTQKTLENFRFLKLNDPSRSVCVAMTLSGSSLGIGEANYSAGLTQFSNEIDVTSLGVVSDAPVELLDPNNEFDLAIYGLAVARPAQDMLTRNVLYSGYFILATVRGGINVNADGDYCAPPSDYTSTTTDYCAINKFNFALQASGE